MSNIAEVYDGWEFHLVEDKLYITSEKNPDVQVVLSSRAIQGLLDYLYFNQTSKQEKGRGKQHEQARTEAK